MLTPLNDSCIYALYSYIHVHVYSIVDTTRWDSHPEPQRTGIEIESVSCTESESALLQLVAKIIVHVLYMYMNEGNRSDIAGTRTQESCSDIHTCIDRSPDSTRCVHVYM